MKITAEFNSNEELQSFISTFGVKNVVEAGAQIQELKPVKKETKVKPQKTEDKPKNNAKPDKTPKENKTEDEPLKITKEMVRAMFTKLIKAGKTKEAKEITTRYGAKRLPDLKEEDYAAAYKDAEELL